MNFFGKKKPSITTNNSHGSNGGGGNNPQTSLQKIKTTMNNIEKRSAFIEKKIQAQIKIAKDKNKAGDKRGALFALKKKKLYEKEIEKLENVRITLETQILTSK